VKNFAANYKSEALNPKQIRITKIQNLKQNQLSFEHLNLEFRYCLEFRILKLGFTPPSWKRAGFYRAQRGYVWFIA